MVGGWSTRPAGFTTSSETAQGLATSNACWNACIAFLRRGDRLRRSAHGGRVTRQQRHLGAVPAEGFGDAFATDAPASLALSRIIKERGRGGRERVRVVAGDVTGRLAGRDARLLELERHDRET